MNKNFIPIVIGGVLLAGGMVFAGYALWNTSYYEQASVETPTENVNSTITTIPASNPGLPVVKTDSSTAPYISTVVVKGTVNPNGAVTAYWYEYGQTPTLGLKTPDYVIGSGNVTIYTPAYITGLASNTNYYFRLGARNSLGTTYGTGFTFKTNTVPVPSGTAPATITKSATDIAKTTANLHGSINPNGSETTFWFEYGLTSEFGFTTAFQSAGSGNSLSANSVSISNLQPLSKYYFRLNSQNQFGTINGEILSFTTKGPATVVVPVVDTNSATSITATSASLHAIVNPSGVATTYWFEYSTYASLSKSTVLTSEQSLPEGLTSISVSATVNNLNRDTKYYYRVIAKNQYGTVQGDIESFATKK